MEMNEVISPLTFTISSVSPLMMVVSVAWRFVYVCDHQIGSSNSKSVY
jgi:hypothetical protein